MKKTLITVLLLLLAVLLVAAFDMRLKTVKYTVESEKITSPVRVALVTDLHSCRYGEGGKNLISAIDAQSPDVVLLGGDIFDDVLSPDRAAEILKRIGGRYACYYVTGNHEYRSGQAEEMCDYISRCGIKVLHGDRVPLRLNGQELSLYGVDDIFAGHYSEGKYSFHVQMGRLVGESAEDENFSMLLSHHPERVEDYEKCDFDLILCGHAHGGQWRIPGLLNGVIAPNQGFLDQEKKQGLFPEYTGGEYILSNGSKMIVSRGLARESTRVPRIFNRPELVIVDIT